MRDNACILKFPYLTLKKYDDIKKKTVTMRFPFTLLLLCTALSFFTACNHDEVVMMEEPVYSGQPEISTRASVLTSSLVKEGEYWRATKRVPLVGKGRIVDDVSNNLVALLSDKIRIQNIVDEDLTNCLSTAGAVNAEVLANQIVAVRDLHHIYAPNQKVGFVFKLTNFKTLGLNVLKSFWITTYLNGKEQESFGSTEGTGVLQLDLISVANNDEIKEISFTVTKEFDKVQLNSSGIDANVIAENLSIYYAFVGENEIKTATAGSTWFPNAHLHEGFTWTNILNSGHIVDNDLTNHAYYGTLGALLGDPHATVDFGCDVPAGSEVGFVISNIDVLNIDALSSTRLITYDAEDKEVERAVIAEAVGLSVVKVGNHARVSMKTTKPCRQVYIKFAGIDIKLGGTEVFYAYACDPVTVDISSRFSFSTVKTKANSYTLPSISGGTISWAVVDAPSGTLPEIIKVTNDKGYISYKIIGMTKDGEYRLSGTFTPNGAQGETATPMPLEFVIRRDAKDNTIQGNHILDETAGAKLVKIKGGGALLSVGDIKNSEYIVDPNHDNYATVVSVIGIAENVGIVAIDLKEPIIPENGRDVRVGFTVRNTFDFLGADVLRFFKICLYNNGQKVHEAPVDNSKIGDVSLIGSKGHKLRMSIQYNGPFDHIELWKSGVLELKLSALHIYNAFWEYADVPILGDINEACMEMLTSSTGAEIDYDNSFPPHAVEVGETYEKLGNLLDKDLENYARYYGTNVAGEARIAIKFPPIPGGSSVGFILADTKIAGVGIAKHVTLEVRSHGAKVESFTEENFLKVGLLGHNKHRIVEARPTISEFDEVVLSIGSVANLLEALQIYGSFTRRDTDGDGIPDGAEDEENPTEPVKPLTASMIDKHVCLHHPLQVKVTEGGEPGVKYTLTCTNTSKNNDKTHFTLELPKDNIFQLPDLAVGEYLISIEKDGKSVYSGTLKAWVHPLETTWKKDARSTDWNKWDNWTEGSPWQCTNVILPTGCVRYPELKQLANDPDGFMNYCANLHIESHAELVNSHLLDSYSYVWMELTLQSGKNYILSTPLTNTVTGDYFIPAKWQGNHAQEYKFVKLTSTNTPENRFAPRLYQRCWSRDVPGKVLTDGVLGTTVITSETDWTAPFNAVAEPITAGMGWMVRADDEGLPTNSLTFRFPKTHGGYSYFDATGAHTGSAEGVYRDKKTMGRFVVDKATTLPLEITVENHTEGATFVTGNPFAAHINIAKFLEVNKNNISEVKLTNGNGTHTVLYRNGEITSTAPGFTHIAPMQGFYVTANTKMQTLRLQFTADMQEQKPGYNIYANGEDNGLSIPKRALTRSASGQNNELRIQAVSAGKSTQCVVRLRPDCHPEFRSGEDSRLLYDSENAPTVAVFTVAGGVAADIQQLPADGARSIDLGWRLEHAREVTLHLSHEAGSEWSRWAIENRQTGERISLNNTETVVKLGQQSTRIGGWRLVKE